jgi:hypothetical protein
VALWGLALAGVMVLGGIVLAVQGGREPVLIGIGLAVVALLVSNFAVLRVRVDDEQVHQAFGIGLFSRRIPLARVRDVEVRRSAWYWGWGIRWTPRGWLWRSSGLDAVWVRLDSGRQAGMGSPDPEGLAGAIRARLDRA